MTVPRGNVQGLGRASRGPGRTGGLELEVERTSKDIEGQYVKSQDMDSDSKSYQKIQQVQSVPIPIYSNNMFQYSKIYLYIPLDSLYLHIYIHIPITYSFYIPYTFPIDSRSVP